MPYNDPPFVEYTVKTFPEAEQKPDHQSEIERALCQRDYEILEAYYPALLAAIEGAVKEKHDPQQIKRWAQNVTGEPVVLQRVYNAARWLAG